MSEDADITSLESRHKYALRDLAQAWADLYVATEISDGRSRALCDKSAEVAREWRRAEKAEAERDGAMAECERLNNEIDYWRRTVDDIANKWCVFARDVGKKVGCLYSTFPDGNQHIIDKIEALQQPATGEGRKVELRNGIGPMGTGGTT